MFYSYGHLIKNKKSSNKIESYNQISILGCILISFIALFINFFFPLNEIFNTILLVLGLIYFFLIKRVNLKKKEIYYIFLTSLVTTTLLLYSNVYRPDAGLYHLPYTSFLNEHKIIFGLSNIHFRFGMISIMQYLSAINNNILFKDIGIVIPLASLVTFFIIHFFNSTLEIFKKNKTNLKNIFSLFIIIFISYKINRYSSYGNDAVGHLSFFYLISIMLSAKKKDLNFISLIAVFAFLNKPTMIVILLFPLLIFIKNYNIKNLRLIYSLSSFLFIFWILKNIVITGCAIYPLKQTCFNNLSWTNMEEIKQESTSGEAWSKAWPDRRNNKISMDDYNKNFNWFLSWKDNHGRYILKIIIPYLITLLMILYLIRKEKNNQNNIFLKKDIYFIFALIVSVIGCILFFIKFPLFRYGYSYLISSIILAILAISKNFSEIKLIKVSKIIFLICLFVILGKQGLRINKNLDSTFLWPRIYSHVTNNKINPRKIQLHKKFSAYQYDGLCMYSKSPCSTYRLNKNIKVQEMFGYTILGLNKN